MWYLLGDVGGTNLRLAAMNAAGDLTARHSGATAGEAGLTDSCAALVAQMGQPPAYVVLAIAGVVEDGAVTLTNAGTRISVDILAKACGADPETVFLLNDFEAAAWSLAEIDPAQVHFLQGGPDAQTGPRVILGPGTGLGVGALLRPEGQPPLAVPGEGGHMRLTPHSAQDVAYFEALTALWPEVQMGATLAVEAEAILSGSGMPLWYRAIASVHGNDAPLRDAEAIFAAARTRSDVNATRAVTRFAQYLAGLAGDLGLAFGARGGVFVTGGVAQANPWIFDAAFTAAFNAGGRHSAWREDLPLALCRDPDFGLRGARNFLRAQMD